MLNQTDSPLPVSACQPVPKARAVIALALLLPFPSLGTAASMFWWPGTILGKGAFLLCKVWILALPLLSPIAACQTCS